MRVSARVAVSAALLCNAILIGSPALIASAAPTNNTSSDPAQQIAVTSADFTAPAFNLADPFIGEDSPVATHVTPVVLHDANQATTHDSTSQSPAIALPPAVSSGLGLMCVLAACMGLRRFAYRPSHGSRRH